MPGWKRGLRSIALGLGISFVLLTGFVMLFEDRFIYFPTPGDVGPSPGEDVELTAADGVRLHAWWLPNPKARATLIYLHGNAGHIGDRRDIVEDLRSLPADVLALDYRGYGKSQGTPSEAGLYADARAAYDWLIAKGVAPKRIVLYGKSLGGAVAADLASKVEVGALILQSTFTSTPDMAGQVMPFFPARLLMRTKYDTLSKMKAIACPKLIVHGRRDEMIPFEMAERNFAAAAEPKESAWFDEGGHNTLIDRNGPAWREALRRFVDRVAPK
jgi:fermentation-respiration switch protein FrsA (DUF1100 family)